jgi:hypothetical protein
MKKSVARTSAWLFLPMVGALGTVLSGEAAAAVPGISINDGSVTEGRDPQAIFTVSLDAAPYAARPVSVTVATVNGSAVAGSDFRFTRQTLTFERGGPNAQQFSVVLVDDNIEEATETFSVKLSAASNARITDNTGVGTILDDDGQPNPPDVSINSTSAAGLYPYNYSPVPERPQVLGGNYSVLAVNDLGMHCVDLDGRIANILPPFQVMLTQVIQKGVSPVLNPTGMSLYYSAASNPADPQVNPGNPPRAIAADGTLFKTNFWQGIPNASYDAFYPPVATPLATGPFPVTEDVGLPVPNAELLYLGDNGIVGDGDERLSAV